MGGSVELRAQVAEMTNHDVWRCAREAIPVHRTVVVELRAEGASGWAEAPAYVTSVFNSGLDTTLASLGLVHGPLTGYDPRCPEQLGRLVAPVVAATPFVAAALEVAAFDLAARLAGQALHDYLGLPDPSGCRSSFSIGIDEPATMRAKLARRPGWAQYKVKLASPRDLHVLRALREETDAPFWVDGNASWHPQDLLPAIPALVDLGVVAIEQPYGVDAVEAQRELTEECPVPVFADESVSCAADLDRALAGFAGINVKVLKAGGLGPALHMLRRARLAGRQTMLGCLPESSAGASAAAHLAGLADHLDLDTIALLATDTGSGVTLDEDGSLRLAAGTGSGFEPDRSSPAWRDARPAAASGERA